MRCKCFSCFFCFLFFSPIDSPILRCTKHDTQRGGRNETRETDLRCRRGERWNRQLTHTQTNKQTKKQHQHTPHTHANPLVVHRKVTSVEQPCAVKCSYLVSLPQRPSSPFISPSRTPLHSPRQIPHTTPTFQNSIHHVCRVSNASSFVNRWILCLWFHIPSPFHIVYGCGGSCLSLAIASTPSPFVQLHPHRHIVFLLLLVPVCFVVGRPSFPVTLHASTQKRKERRRRSSPLDEQHAHTNARTTPHLHLKPLLLLHQLSLRTLFPLHFIRHYY